MSDHILLTFNPGSSTLKLGLFAVADDHARRLGKGIIDLHHTPLTLSVSEGGQVTDIPLMSAVTEDLREVIDETLRWLVEHFGVAGLTAVGHRVVHGGDHFGGPVLVDHEAFEAICALTPLAPLHQPQSVRLIRALHHLRPDLPQVASFDTAFHRTQADVVRRFALPRAMFDAGIKRYGFHGLSYKYIAGQLGRHDPTCGGRVVVAHLGSGASLCALAGGISRDTSMGFSTLDGIPMSTRCGTLDPGVVIHMLKQEKRPLEEVEDILYHRSGLLGVSDISGDTRALLASHAEEAREAIELFAFRIARETAALANTLGGLDGFVFTAGIGEHQGAIRSAVAAHLGWLGMKLDPESNAANAALISTLDSKVQVFVIPTDEEQVIADEAVHIIQRLEPVR
ncbi:acetate/propionate family kinase [Xanthobacter sp. DSM 24535]|uniref:acetate/propionate family kinase n=1 Tax=Roseixanthobacter psychrophilus TaxID=3119917 RepID=UPI003726F52D